MTSSETRDPLPHLRGRSVVLDANLLVLWFIGSVRPSLIARFPRTNRYTEKSYAVLLTALNNLGQAVTTAHILTEADNLIRDKLRTDDRIRYELLFYALLREVKEETIEASSLPDDYLFRSFGITDAALAELLQRGHVILTDDAPLYAALSRRSAAAINFTHLEQAQI